MRHVDGYDTLPPPGKVYREDGEVGSLTNPHRWDDDGTPLPARSQYAEPELRWNGYVEYTQPHEDGECEAHRPPQGVWRSVELPEGP